MVSHKNQSIVIIEVFLLFDLHLFLSSRLTEGVQICLNSHYGERFHWVVWSFGKQFMCSNRCSEERFNKQQSTIKKKERITHKHIAKDHKEIYFSNKYRSLVCVMCICADTGFYVIWSLAGIISLWCSFKSSFVRVDTKTNCNASSISLNTQIAKAPITDIYICFMDAYFWTVFFFSIQVFLG